MSEQMLSVLAVVAIVVLLVIPNYLLLIWRERKTANLLAEAHQSGRHEPVSIRPFIDPGRCMGSGACVRACPEKHVLEVIDGQARIVNGAACIGHGACMAACPVSAIELVFGSERRGIDLPDVGPDFQTNVPGLYIAGELGGMGLIANAVEQGTQAMRNLVGGLGKGGRGLDADVVVVGAGPSGIAAALVAREKAVRCIVIDQDELGGAVRHYPRQKLVMTRPMTFAGYGTVKVRTLRKEELIELFEDVVAKTGLEINSGERLDGLRPLAEGGFEVRTPRRTISCGRVLLCIGRRGTPRKLGVEGEDLEKVAYRLIDPELYQHQHILVVGAGDSAIEAATELAEQPGNQVTLAVRRASVTRPKAANLARLEAAVASGAVDVLYSCTVAHVDLDRATVLVDGAERVVANDFVFVFAGGVLPTKLLEASGITIQRHFGKHVVPVSGRTRT